VTPAPEPHGAAHVIEQERRRLGRQLEEVARLCESDASPGVFYGELLKRLLESLAGAAGAVWTRTPQGNLQLQFQINLREVGVDRTDEARQVHGELLRLAVGLPKPMHLPPHSGLGQGQEGRPAPGNPTDHLLLLVPIKVGDAVGGLIEIWQHANRPAAAVPGFLQFMGLMAELAGRYQRNQMLGQMTGQQALWTQLEAFARQIHGSLNPVEVSYLVANEGRRLVECDRVSVGVRYGRRVAVEAVSGADVVEKRSNLVKLMRRLCDRVLAWGEKLVFTGTKDDSLPPLVLEALDAYLVESPSKLLVVLPLKDEREQKKKGPSRAVLVMECFEPPAEPQQHIARLDVVAKHAVSALYNAVEHRRVPMRWAWMPIAKLQEGVGGPTSAIVMACVVALTLLVSILVLVPYPLKEDATGQLLPQTRVYVYSPLDARVTAFHVQPGDTFGEGRSLVDLYEFEKLGQKILDYQAKLKGLADQEASLDQAVKNNPGLKESERQRLLSDIAGKRLEYESNLRLLQELMKRTEADQRAGNEGAFTLKAPAFTAEQSRLLRRKEWTVLNSSFREEFTHRTVRPSDPLLRLGAKEGPWEIELKIPQRHIGQVLQAFEASHAKELPVDFLLRSDPTRTFKGWLRRDKIGGEAVSDKENKDEQEPVVLAYVRIDNSDPGGPEIEPGYRLPPELLLSGAEVRAKVICGPRPMGYSLLHEVWEFLYERVVFYF
jgi:hypothetical protein